MIVSEIYSGSGLGNQLWMIVVPRIIAERMGYEWGIQQKKETPFKGCAFMKNFDLGKQVIGGYGPEGGPPVKLPDGISDYYREFNDLKYPSYMGGEDVLLFDNYLWNELPDNTKIDGYFQNLDYINDRRHDIIKWLDYDPKVLDYSSEDICVIQFRGGDYLTGASWIPPEYYHNAAKHMLDKNPNMKFVCVTDDPENAKRFIPFAEIVGSAVMDEKDPYQGSIGWYVYPGGPVGVDYSILNTAKNAIISSSTFSFWPVWTNLECDVIAPKHWFDWKISDGWWRPYNSIVDDWYWLDRNGDLMTGIECKKEYEVYKNTKQFYRSLK
jgi:hypothetical protein